MPKSGARYDGSTGALLCALSQNEHAMAYFRRLLDLAKQGVRRYAVCATDLRKFYNL
jgi:hypothetical protein